MRDLTDRPFGVNIAQAFVRDPNIAEFVIDQGVEFVTTSAGSPTKYTSVLKSAGLTVYHVVPTLAAALKAVDAGVDGLVVEGGEGGGFKSPTPVSTMVLLPLVRSRVDVPIIAAGGIVDGASMAAAFALGAEGVQMGTRMVSAAESPVHDNWKQAIVAAAETDTLFLNQRHSPALRALRTARTEALVDAAHNVFGDFGDARALYFGGDMEAAIALSGQVAGRIDAVRPVADIIADTVAEFVATVERLATGVAPMTYQTVTYSAAGGVGTVTLNRPEQLNGITNAMMREVHELLHDVADDDAVGVVVLTGAGRAFCPGADLAHYSSGGADEELRDEYFDIPVLLHEMPQVTIAAINGACAGAGLGWACACDLRYVARSAELNTAFLDVAVAGDMGLPWTLPRLIGAGAARELSMLPRKLSADEAAEHRARQRRVRRRRAARRGRRAEPSAWRPPRRSPGAA